MRDTAELNTVLDYIRENLISASDLLRLFRSFSSLASMIPKGSNKIWGNQTWASEDTELIKDNFSHGKLIDFVDRDEFLKWASVESNSVEIDNSKESNNKKVMVDDDEGVSRKAFFALNYLIDKIYFFFFSLKFQFVVKNLKMLNLFKIILFLVISF